MGKRTGEAFAGTDELIVMGTLALRRECARLQLHYLDLQEIPLYHL